MKHANYANYAPKFILIILTSLLVLGSQHAIASPLAQTTQAATQAVTAPETRTATPTKTLVPSATATQKITLDGSYENLFPMVIRFYVGMGLARSKIASARLKVFQVGIIDQTIDVPLNDTTVRVFGDNATGIYFPWPLTSETALEPFRQYSFQWFVQDTDKHNYQSEFFTIEFYDQHKTWQRAVEAPISLYWYSPGLSGPLLRQTLLRTHKLLEKNTGVSNTYKFIIYDAGDNTCQSDPNRPGQPVVIAYNDYVVYPCDPNNAAVIYAARGFTLIKRTSGLFEPLQDDLIAKMTEDAYTELFKKAAAPPPAWLKGGIIQLYGLVGRANALLLAREQARLDRLLQLDELSAPAVAKKDDFGASVRDWNAQAYMLTLYLSARFGAQTPIELAKAIGNNSKFEDELPKLTKGVSLSQIYSDWKSWLLLPDADAAIRWNLYITNPTPTLTPTETLYPTFPPLTDAPLVTDTPLPSRTRVPTATITPTATPRPPGSLNNTPTAPPIATPTPAPLGT